MSKINLTIGNEFDGFEKLGEEEARKLITKSMVDSLDMLKEEFTPGELKLQILEKVNNHLGNDFLNLSTVESICSFIDSTIKTLSETHDIFVNSENIQKTE